MSNTITAHQEGAAWLVSFHKLCGVSLPCPNTLDVGARPGETLRIEGICLQSTGVFRRTALATPVFVRTRNCCT